LLLAIAAVGAPDAPPPGSPGVGASATIDGQARALVVETLAAKLDSMYVMPEVATKLSAALREKLTNKGYDACTSAPALAKQLTEDLQAIAKDKHLRVMRPQKMPLMPAEGKPTPEMLKKMQRMMRKQNYGFVKVERLPGNIGLLDLRGFAEEKEAEQTVAAAMNFLAGTDALILDLRKNGGGSPRMVQLLCSYLLPADKPILLNTMHWRKGNRVEEFWTVNDLPGKRYQDRDVYVLTSQRTFSAAEECTYNLKNLKRATIVGETTGGGAHPGGMVPLGEGFAAFIPTGRAINPITKTNWEGTGVKPDVEVTADKALDAAIELALKRIRERSNEPEDKRLLEQDLRMNAASKNAQSPR
jgi:C-terminal processing protease CtpA/Prc